MHAAWSPGYEIGAIQVRLLTTMEEVDKKGCGSAVLKRLVGLKDIGENPSLTVWKSSDGGVAVARFLVHLHDFEFGPLVLLRGRL